MKTKRNRQYPPKTWSQVVAPETSPFNDMFGTPEDIFADVLVGERCMQLPPWMGAVWRTWTNDTPAASGTVRCLQNGEEGSDRPPRRNYNNGNAPSQD